jgi:hypothetical protein
MVDNLVPLSPVASRVVDELKAHTPFAEAIVRRQAERAGVNVATMSPGDLTKVMPLILAASTGFVEPDVLVHLKWTFRG